MPAIGAITAASAVNGLGGYGGVEPMGPQSSGVASHDPKSEGQLRFAKELRDSMNGEGEKGDGFPMPQLPASTQTPEEIQQGLQWLDAAKPTDQQHSIQDIQAANQDIQVSSGIDIEASGAKGVDKPSRVRRSAGGDGTTSYNLQKALFDQKRAELSKFYAEKVERGTRNHVVSWFSYPWLSNASDKKIVFNFEKYQVRGEGPVRHASKYKDDFGYQHASKSIEIGAGSWERVPSESVFWIDGAYGTEGWFSARPAYVELAIAPVDTYIESTSIVGNTHKFTVKVPKKAVWDFLIQAKKEVFGTELTIDYFNYFFTNDSYERSYKIKLKDQPLREFDVLDDNNGNYKFTFKSSEDLGGWYSPMNRGFSLVKVPKYS